MTEKLHWKFSLFIVHTKRHNNNFRLIVSRKISKLVNDLVAFESCFHLKNIERVNTSRMKLYRSQKRNLVLSANLLFQEENLKPQYDLIEDFCCLDDLINNMRR